MHFATSLISLLAVTSTAAAGWCATGYEKKNNCNADQGFSACESDTGCFSVGDNTIRSIKFTDMKGYKATFFESKNCNGPTWYATKGVCEIAEYTSTGSSVPIKSYRVCLLSPKVKWISCLLHSTRSPRLKVNFRYNALSYNIAHWYGLLDTCL
jgi:hypothetical protein